MITKEEAQKTIKTMKEVAERIGKSKEEVLKLLVATGFYTQKGNLKKAYR